MTHYTGGHGLEGFGRYIYRTRTLYVVYNQSFERGAGDETIRA